MNAYGPETLLELYDGFVGHGLHGVATVVLALQADDGAHKVEVARLAGITFEVVDRHAEFLLVLARVHLVGVCRWVRMKTSWTEHLDRRPIWMRLCRDVGTPLCPLCDFKIFTVNPLRRRTIRL